MQGGTVWQGVRQNVIRVDQGEVFYGDELLLFPDRNRAASEDTKNNHTSTICSRNRRKRHQSPEVSSAPEFGWENRRAHMSATLSYPVCR